MIRTGNRYSSFMEVQRLHLWIWKMQWCLISGRKGTPHLAYQYHGHKKGKKSLHTTELIIFFSPFLTQDVFCLVLDQIQIVNKDTAHGTQKIIEKLMSYHKVKPLKV